jgi:fermentation-respiration switch protein FrsA (DUF1100 family)
VRAIVVDSSFSDYHLITKEKLASFFLTWPLQWLLPQLTIENAFSPVESVHAVSPIPLLFIHGDRHVSDPIASLSPSS